MSNAIIVNGILGKREVTSYVDPYPGLAGTDKVSISSTCGRCGGTGIFHWYTYMGPAQGSCFGCWGSGKVSHDRQVARLRLEVKKEAYYRENEAEIQAYWAAENERVRAEELAANFARDWDDAHAEQARRVALVQGFIGEIGEKISVTATIKVAKYMAAQQYGWAAKMFVIAETTDGNIVKISGSSASLFDLERGDVVTLTGKVAGHENYQGQDQTTLSHVKATVTEVADES